jgi:hypothetical protein
VRAPEPDDRVGRVERSTHESSKAKPRVPVGSRP